jgi:hypothetical protein
MPDNYFNQHLSYSGRDFKRDVFKSFEKIWSRIEPEALSDPLQAVRLKHIPALRVFPRFIVGFCRRHRFLLRHPSYERLPQDIWRMGTAICCNSARAYGAPPAESSHKGGWDQLADCGGWIPRMSRKRRRIRPCQLKGDEKRGDCNCCSHSGWRQTSINNHREKQNTGCLVGYELPAYADGHFHSQAGPVPMSCADTCTNCGAPTSATLNHSL